MLVATGGRVRYHQTARAILEPCPIQSAPCLYDLVAPTKDNTKKDDWNTFVITADGSRITVVINGEKVNAWTSTYRPKPVGTRTVPRTNSKRP